MAGKRDFKKDLDCYRAKLNLPELVEVPDLTFLMIDGRGDPNGPSFADAIAALYPVAYTLKFASKQTLGLDYVVMPLEGLWWADDMGSFTTTRDKSQWNWTLLTMVPEWVDAGMFSTAIEQLRARKPPARVDDVRLDVLREGLCVQALHVGSFDDEAPLLESMHHDVIPGWRLTMTGRHHEVYLSNRTVPPERRRTILRQPVRPLPR